MLVKHVWIDQSPQNDFNPLTDSADVLVEMEDGRLWQARFVTLAYLKQEMQLSLDVVHSHKRTLAQTAFLALETPHVIVENLLHVTIEDIVDNLVVLGVFESVFALIANDDETKKNKRFQAV
ncbi:MAG: hypothetical protein JW966_07265 [Anaerolineae bacterium]|nr:hypothetical protein [Anaerolineae bacterium]